MRKTLLLCFIHGFKGGEDTFGERSEFSRHLASLVGAALPRVNVRAVTYPRYETRGDLYECVARFRYWLLERVIDLEVANGTPSPTVDPSVRVVLVGHSNGGPPLWLVADARPGSVRAVVALEPLGPAFANDTAGAPADARPYGLTNIPITFDPPVNDPSVELKKVVRASNSSDLADCMLQVEPARGWPNLAGLPVLVVTGQASYHARYDWGTVEFLKQVGVDVEHLPLEAANITGNGHFMFMETNSNDIAEKVDEWLQSKKPSHSHFRTIAPDS